jgi:predicted ribosomally synthesized peptide with SipW-like signal peptide
MKLKSKKALYIYGSLVLLLILTIGVTFAAFSDKANFGSSTFSVASADIKLLDVIGGGTVEENLVDEKPGPQFENVTAYWSEDYMVEIYNNATSDVALSSWAHYENVAEVDPAELRQYIYVEILDWVDENMDGLVQEEELGTSYGRKTIVKWNTQGFDLGILPQGTVRSFVLRFSTDNLSDSKQGASLLYDFEFNAEGL